MITQIYSIQTAEEALACIEAGADVLVAGSAIFHAQDRAAAIQLIKGIS